MSQVRSQSKRRHKVGKAHLLPHRLQNLPNPPPLSLSRPTINPRAPSNPQNLRLLPINVSLKHLLHLQIVHRPRNEAETRRDLVRSRSDEIGVDRRREIERRTPRFEPNSLEDDSEVREGHLAHELRRPNPKRDGNMRQRAHERKAKRKRRVSNERLTTLSKSTNFPPISLLSFLPQAPTIPTLLLSHQTHSINTSLTNSGSGFCWIAGRMSVESEAIPWAWGWRGVGGRVRVWRRCGKREWRWGGTCRATNGRRKRSGNSQLRARREEGLADSKLTCFRTSSNSTPTSNLLAPPFKHA